MKFLVAQLLYFFKNKESKRNVVFLTQFLVFLASVITIYSVLFHYLMQAEGREFSWITGFYWTLTVMSTLGFGDITFHSDIGLIFTLLVLISGIVLLLIMLPFSFIQFFWAPWLDAQTKARTPRKVSKGTKDHIIITNYCVTTEALVKKLTKLGYDYVLIENDLQAALDLHDNGYKVILGAPDDQKTYERINVHDAALIVVLSDDLTNTNISFTIREINKSVPIVTSCDNINSLDILNFPEKMRVFQFMDMLGIDLAQRTMGGLLGTHIIGQFEDFYIAETLASDTALVGRTIAETQLRQSVGVNIVGIWTRGVYRPPSPGTVIDKSTILLLAGSQESLDKYDQIHSNDIDPGMIEAPVLILGGGRVGKAALEFLEIHGQQYTVVEKNKGAAKRLKNCIVGDAADIKVLKEAGIDHAKSVVITTHNDAMNIYLTFYCRQLNPNIQIISRAEEQHNVSKLHTAGGDLVLSYATMSANAILDQLHPQEASMFSEGLNIFTVQIGQNLVGQSLVTANIREETGCSVIGLKRSGSMVTTPDPKLAFTSKDELVLIGTLEAEALFRKKYKMLN
ncbi:MAG: NAD-binding protein [Desulfobacterales bacterium]|nr:NAD-binding protein [Desulfobacterales bacterium]